MFQSVATLGLGVGVAMYYSWKLGLVAMAFIPVIFVAIYNQSKTQKKNKKVGNQSFVERSTKVKQLKKKQLLVLFANNEILAIFVILSFCV